MSGLAKLDLYHLIMLFVFVWAALYPAAFQRNIVWVLIYADVFIIAKYIFSLIQTTTVVNPLFVLIGLSSNKYNPDNNK
jgi:hypothetical protein